jgi:hypothetical protein
MAVTAAARYGVASTARRLGLNATRLRNQVRRLTPTEVAADPAGFVELSWPVAVGTAECILEAEERSGRKLRIHLKGPATTQAVLLGRLLWMGEE